MSRRITIRHPGYPRPNVLLMFPARDGQGRDRAHHPTIIAACSIITDHPDDVWLEGLLTGERVTADVEGLLPAGEYHLRISHPDPSVPYPVVPNFDVWTYPHQDLPSLWQEAAENDGTVAAHTTLGTCRIADRELGLNTAHILPRREHLWFRRNEMERYGGLSSRGGGDAMDSSTNILPLQAHAHKLWDSLHFCIVPRRVGTATAWVTQMMVDNDELERDWHNKTLRPLAGRAKENLYARLAWHIFPRLITFVTAGPSRVLTVATVDGTKETREYTPGECEAFTLGQGNHRSASPKKRWRGESGGPTDGSHRREDPYGWSDPESIDSAVAGVTGAAKGDRRSRHAWPTTCTWGEGHDDRDEPDRGRKRTRGSIT